MSSTDRRGSIRLIIAACAASAAATRAAGQDILRGGLISPGSAPMRYRRIVRRDLVDGRQIRVRRDFEVAFESIAEGYLLAGRQRDVEVDVPQALARFAELERERDESALFPIALDAFGQIRSPVPSAFGDAQVRAAVAEGIQAISRLPVAASEREMAQRFVAAFHNAGEAITAIMPPDLFAPAGQPRRTEQVVDLPDGQRGIVATVFAGEHDPATGLMTSARREIVTEIGTSRRVNCEQWSLTAF